MDNMDSLFIAGLKGMSAGFALGALVAIIALLIFIYKKFILPKINKTKDIASAISNHGTEAIKGYMEKHAHTTKTNLSNENDDLLYEYVLEEIEKNDLQKGLWAKALALSEGNNDKAKSLYMQHRVQALKNELSQLHIDFSGLSKEKLWSILQDGLTFEEKTNLQEMYEDNLNTQKRQNAKKENEKYTKFGGWLIFFGFLIVLGNLQILSVFELLSSGHQETMTYLFVNEHYAIADYLKNVSYLLFCGIFLQIMLTITFFTKSILMKSVTILVFIGTILIAIINVWLFLSLQEITPPELFNAIFKPSVVYKIYMTPILSLLPALVWILYFSFSQRAKKTFVKESDFPTLIFISAIIPVILFMVYSSSVNKIENTENALINEFKIKDSSTLFEIADNLYQKKSYGKAKVLYIELLNRNYQPAKINFMLGEIDFSQKSYTSAIEYYKASVAISDKTTYIPTLLYHTGISFEKLGKNKEAQSFFKVLKDEYPDSPEAVEIYKKVDPNFKPIQPKNEEKVLPSKILDVSRKTFSEGLAAVEFNGKWGYIDNTGNWVIQPIFNYAENFAEGLASAMDENYKRGYIDKHANWIIPPIFYWAENFSEGLAAVAPSLGIYGYIDKKGNWVIQPKFWSYRGSYGTFSEGRAKVIFDDGTTNEVFINKQGNIVK